MRISTVQSATIPPKGKVTGSVSAHGRIGLSDLVRVRGAAILVLLAGLSCFYVAARLTPSAAGHGTHRELGYPACLMPVLANRPCPTCGMTTAFAYAVRGQLFRAFHAQPAGLALALAIFAGCLGCVRVILTGQYSFMKLRIRPGWLAVWILAVVLLGWIYKWVTFTAW